jgi:AcrR family transcriptional regulator
VPTSSSSPAATRSTSRRDELYDAVIESVAIHGFDRASLRDIAARAGMTHAGVLTHFESKEHLLLAAVQRREARDREDMERILATGASDRDVTAALVAGFADDPKRERHWLALMVAASDPGHPAHAHFTQRHDRIRAQVERFAGDPTTRTVGRFDPETRATLYMAVMDGLRLQTILNPTTDAASAAAHFIDLILVDRAAAQP